MPSIKQFPIPFPGSVGFAANWKMGAFDATKAEAQVAGFLSNQGAPYQISDSDLVVADCTDGPGIFSVAIDAAGVITLSVYGSSLPYKLVYAQITGGGLSNQITGTLTGAKVGDIVFSTTQYSMNEKVPLATIITAPDTVQLTFESDPGADSVINVFAFTAA